MFGTNFKFSLSSVTKALKLKSRNSQDEHSLVLDDENIPPEHNSKENRPKWERSLKYPSNYSDAYLSVVHDSESSEYNPTKTYGEISSHKPAMGSNHTRIEGGKENSGYYLNCKIKNCCCKSFFRDPNVVDQRQKRVPFMERECCNSITTGNILNEVDSCAGNHLNHPLQNVHGKLSNHKTRNNHFYNSQKSKLEASHGVVSSYRNNLDELSHTSSYSCRNVSVLNRNGKTVPESTSNLDYTILEQKSVRENFSRVNMQPLSISSNVSTDFSDKNVFIFNSEATHTLTQILDTVKLSSNKRSSTDVGCLSNRVYQNENIYEVIRPKSYCPQTNDSVAASSNNFHSKIKMNAFDGIAGKIKVKSTRVKNIRQLKRLKHKSSKMRNLERSRTFSGFDNQAFRKSLCDLNSAKNDSDDKNYCDNFDNKLDYSMKCYKSSVQLKKNYGLYSDNFKAKDRIQIYNLPVTSFYMDKLSYNSDKLYDNSDKSSYNSDKSYNLKTNRPASVSCSTFVTGSDESSVYAGKAADLNKNVVPARNMNDPFQKSSVSNLKRHGSFGYFQDDSFNSSLSFTRRLSLDNINKVSSTCGIKNIPDVSNKILKQRKVPNLDIHVHALFAAVEHGQVDKAKTILESSEVDVNSMNSDGLSPLDVAILSNNKPLIKLLISYGAQDGRKFYSSEDMRDHLYHLLHESERRVQELGSSLRKSESDQTTLSTSSNNIPSITIGDTAQNKTYLIWERRTKGLRKMLLGFEQIRPPDPPTSVSAEVTSTSSVMVYFQEPDNKDSCTVTKFKVQWSTDKDFSALCGYYEVTDPRLLRYHIHHLNRGQSYYIRVACGNLKGYSVYKLSTPACCIPSSWHDISSKDLRSPNAMRLNLEDIFNNVVAMHPYLKNNSDLYGSGGELLVNQRKKKTIKQLFTAASKFQKHLRRGVYLSCLLYHEDKVLVTNEDFLPVIEVDETYPKKMHTDFHWFFKVAFSWCDLKWLKNDMEKSQNSSAVFRIKLLQAAAQMQTALSIQELGKLYHKLVRDTEGTIVISVINYIHSPKSVSVLNLRWLPLAKLAKRMNMVNIAESNVGDILMSSIPDQITYHQVSSIRLPRGLYLGYLKMRSSVESLQVLVPYRAPNMPPNCKIRDNPHVTAEEWEWLIKKENLKESLSAASHQQRLFIEQIAITSRRLFSYMEIADEDAGSHRLYDAEVIEVSRDVSLIMIVPPVETACSMPGQRELLLQRPDLLPLTVQVFEMVHFGTYQLDLISLYSRLSCIIEMDNDLAQHSLRKAFSSVEVSTAKSRLVDLESIHLQLNTAWKQARWLLDVISFARDRLSISPTNIKHLLSIHPKRSLPITDSHRFLQPPEPKTAKSRGSWPGVGVGRHLGRIPTEMSRSEQLLSSDSMNPQSLTKPIEKHALPQLPFSSQESDGLSRTSRSEGGLIELSADQSTKSVFNAQSSSGESVTGSQLSVSSDESSIAKVPEIEDGIIVPIPTPAIIQIYAAYNTGLPCGTSLKLHVTAKTSAREIVELFVKQLNMSVLLKGKDGPVYSADQFSKFCLVAVIGARERCLRDDFKLLQLQEPWKDGRLYVRRKSDVLAAIEHSSKQTSTFV